MKLLLTLLLLGLLTATGCRAADGPFVGRHYTAPDVAIQAATLVYRDAESGQEVPIVAGQRPVAGTPIAIRFDVAVVSGSDAKRAEWALVDEDGNELLADEIRFPRNREAGSGRRYRRLTVTGWWHIAERQRSVSIVLKRVNGFADWNKANDVAVLSWSVAPVPSEPQVVP